MRFTPLENRDEGDALGLSGIEWKLGEATAEWAMNGAIGAIEGFIGVGMCGAMEAFEWGFIEDAIGTRVGLDGVLVGALGVLEDPAHGAAIEGPIAAAWTGSSSYPGRSCAEAPDAIKAEKRATRAEYCILVDVPLVVLLLEIVVEWRSCRLSDGR